MPETRDGVNGCKFEHGERFGGLTSFMMGEGWVAGLLGIRKMSEKGFAAFNADLKRKCEGEGESAKRAGELGMKEVYEM